MKFSTDEQGSHHGRDVSLALVEALRQTDGDDASFWSNKLVLQGLRRCNCSDLN
jgi:hypothetical protein